MSTRPLRQKKLRALQDSIVRGDFDAARRMLEKATAAGRSPCARNDPADLLSACGGTETSIDMSGRAGRYWRIHRNLAQVSPRDVHIAGQYASVMRGARQRLDELEASAGLCHAANSRPEDLLFMDIETCGLSGAAIFLVGMMYFRDGELVFEQCLARDYDEEPAILAAFGERLGQTGVLVTFNGRAFDMSMIRQRAGVHDVTVSEGKGPPHLDVLIESRRCWRGRVPNCRLQTLERLMCGRQRVGDIPSAAIPDAYHRFVRTRDARQMRDILHHNLLDLLTTAQLLCAILTGCEGPI